jgi:hypothetical protein
MKHPFIQPGGTILRRQQRMESSGIDDPFQGDTLHLDPRKGLKLTSGVVEDWADIVRGVHTATQATASKRPTPGTAPVQLSFDATDWLNVPDSSDLRFLNGVDFSIMFCIEYISGDFGGPMMVGAPGVRIAANVGYNGFDTSIDSGNSGRMSIRCRDDNDDFVQPTAFTGLTGDGFNVFSATFDWSGNLSIYKNGGTPNTASMAGLTGDLTAGNGLTISKSNIGDNDTVMNVTHIVLARRLWTVDQHNARGRFLAGEVGKTWVDV